MRLPFFACIAYPTLVNGVGCKKRRTLRTYASEAYSLDQIRTQEQELNGFWTRRKKSLDLILLGIHCTPKPLIEPLLATDLTQEYAIAPHLTGGSKVDDDANNPDLFDEFGGHSKQRTSRLSPSVKLAPNNGYPITASIIKENL